MVDRRQFVTTATAALVGAGMTGPFARLAHAGRMVDWFRSNLNAQAELQGAAWHSGELVALHETHVSEEVEQCTLVFRLSPGEHVKEGIYQATISGRQLQLFLQPAGEDEAGSYCVAAVSRLVANAEGRTSLRALERLGVTRAGRSRRDR